MAKSGSTDGQVKADHSNVAIKVVAVMPGPRNGMTLMTERIVNELQECHPTQVVDLGHGYRGPGRRWQIQKAWNSWRAASAIRTSVSSDLQNRTDASTEWLYLVLNSHGGLRYNLWHAGAARKVGLPIVAHHHVWSYLSKRDDRMAKLLDVMGDDAIHVVACPFMADELERVYDRKLRFAYVTPGIIGPSESEQATTSTVANDRKKFVLGMLSNLTMAKGVGDAIGVFESLRKRDLPVRLEFAGPIRDTAAQAAIEACRDEWGDQVVHHGPLYESEKRNFYRRLDAFVFPTRYVNESWGIVLNEALMAGVPVITNRRGCTGYLVGPSGGRVSTCDEAFVAEACERIGQWISDPRVHSEAKNSAFQRGRELRQQAEAQLKRFVSAFSDGVWPTDAEGKSNIQAGT